MEGPTVNLYTQLGVSETATKTEITKAFRKLSLKHHPDKGGSHEEFNVVARAYDILSDRHLRCVYDNYSDSGLQVYQKFQSAASHGTGSFNASAKELKEERQAVALAFLIGYLLIVVWDYCWGATGWFSGVCISSTAWWAWYRRPKPAADEPPNSNLEGLLLILFAEGVACVLWLFMPVYLPPLTAHMAYYVALLVWANESSTYAHSAAAFGVIALWDLSFVLAAIVLAVDYFLRPEALPHSYFAMSHLYAIAFLSLIWSYIRHIPVPQSSSRIALPLGRCIRNITSFFLPAPCIASPLIFVNFLFVWTADWLVGWLVAIRLEVPLAIAFFFFCGYQPIVLYGSFSAAFVLSCLLPLGITAWVRQVAWYLTLFGLAKAVACSKRLDEVHKEINKASRGEEGDVSTASDDNEEEKEDRRLIDKFFGKASYTFLECLLFALCLSCAEQFWLRHVDESMMWPWVESIGMSVTIATAVPVCSLMLLDDMYPTSIEERERRKAANEQ
eukprot:TRINITY_DN1988_c2_g1_i1.p1 TRINITY_DN1988_c2_g1~~TRINITY_DN1988_c2_g1_i1.p1  ORF type:complete len:502 (+),score=64.19 TRINITY_DN1988_c2_g1_i1:174-1679(+)